MTVKLEVERLVLEGMDLKPAERERLADAISGELSALVAKGERHTPVNDPDDPVQRLGVAIGRAIHGGLRL